MADKNFSQLNPILPARSDIIPFWRTALAAAARNDLTYFMTGAIRIVATTDYPGFADYRATGSGDQAVINQAIADVAALGGGIVHVRAGIYVCNSNFVPAPNVMVIGDGWVTVFKTADNTNMHLWFVSNASNSVFKDFSCDGNKANNQTQTGHLMRFDNSSNVLVENVYTHDSGLHGMITNIAVTNLKIRNCRSENNGVNANGSGVYLNNTTDVQVEGLFTSGNQLDGLQWKTSTRITISNINSHDNGRYGLYAIDNHANIANVYTHNNQIGIFAENSASSNTSVNVVNADSKGNSNDGVRISNSNNCNLDNVRSYNNGNGAVGAGLRLLADTGLFCNHNNIQNCQFFDNQGTPSQDHGILATGAGTVDKNIVQGNQIYGNAAQFTKNTWGANNIDANNIIIP